MGGSVMELGSGDVCPVLCSWEYGGGGVGGGSVERYDPRDCAKSGAYQYCPAWLMKTWFNDTVPVIF